jgi:hypothetical protein
MSLARVVGSIFTGAFLLAGCAQTVGSQVPIAAPAISRSPSEAMPLDYPVTITNSLKVSLEIALSPGKDATVDGSSSFAVAPGQRETRRLRIPAFAPGTIVSIDATDATRQLRMSGTILLVDSYVAFRMNELTGVNENATMARVNGNSSVAVTLDLKGAESTTTPAARGAVGNAEPTYSVKLENDLTAKPIDVDVTPGREATLESPSAFELGPEENRTILLSDPVAAPGTAELTHLIDAATKEVAAKIELIKGQNTDDIRIGDMFEMQMQMQHLSQLSEMSAVILSASNTMVLSMARSVK